MSKKVLFILKRREDYNPEKHTSTGLQTGLYNSASYMNDMLSNNGVISNMSIVVDNNDIDREVTKYKPDYVIIEALWVTPTKFGVLTKLHPNVTWIIRLHSEIPFLSNEGMAIDWIYDYAKFNNVIIAANAPRALNEVSFLLKDKLKLSDTTIKSKVIYLPNYYPQQYVEKTFNKDKDVIDIGCFGAIRPLKNHLLQAISAIKFAKAINKKLVFHINSGRVEMKGEPIMRNLEALFINLDEHELMVHEWLPRDEFLVLCGTIDIGMQCSFSETFNIVAADLISQGIPLIGSSEIPWINQQLSAKPVDMEEMYSKLLLTYTSPNDNIYLNRKGLTNYTDVSKEIWLNMFKKY